MKIHFQKIPKINDASFACQQFREKIFNCPYHQHQEMELIHIEKSYGRTVIGDTPGMFHPGQVYLFASNLPHLFLNIPQKGKGRTEAWSRAIFFLPECLGTGFWNLPETKSISRLFHRASRGLLWEHQAASHAITQLNEIFSANGTYRIARFLELLEFLASSRNGQPLASPNYSPIQSPVDSERLARVLGYVDDELSGQIHAVKAAKYAGLSASGFGRFFHRHMGGTFVSYVIGQRIAEAKRLLIETDQTIVEICFLCGFQNLSNFNRHFRVLNQSTPSEFRKNIKLSAA